MGQKIKSKTMKALIVENGNERFRIPLDKGGYAAAEAIMACIDEITGYNAGYFKEERIEYET